MLHTKFQGNQPSVSGEEEIFKVFIIYGQTGDFGHVIYFKYKNFLYLFA
ncbi:MAG: hypothetical protein AB2693_29310 [Candidatus Thiodiazotropha sp.]